MPIASIVTHVPFEGPGTLGDALARAGFEARFLDAPTDDLAGFDSVEPDLMVVMGGPVGVYEQDAYPFLRDEIRLLRQRLALRLPTIGICLGAQLIAAALGAEVFPGANGKEIGWGVPEPAVGASSCPEFEAFLATGVKVLHWHGDTFDLPSGASLLASSSAYVNQAFALGPSILALQFHPEVTSRELERWLVGHACELAHANIDVVRLRAECRESGPVLEKAAARFWQQWLAEVFRAT